MTHGDIDTFDRSILRHLQEDTTRSLANLAALVGLTTAPVWKRINALEKLGLIIGYRAVLDRNKLGFSVVAYVSIELGDMSRLDVIATKIAESSNALEVHRIGNSRHAHLLIKVVAVSIAECDALTKGWGELSGVRRVEAQLVLQSVKEKTALPI